DGKEFRIMKKDRPLTQDVSGYFIFIDYFVSLLKDGSAEILEVSEEDFKNLPKKYENKEPCAFVESIFKKFSDASDAEDEGEEIETNSDSSNVSDSSDVDEEIIDVVVDDSEEEKELAILEVK